jgi:hypothetical protein
MQKGEEYLWTVSWKGYAPDTLRVKITGIDGNYQQSGRAIAYFDVIEVVTTVESTLTHVGVGSTGGAYSTELTN